VGMSAISGEKRSAVVLDILYVRLGYTSLAR
jgi:hypothetical protein